MNNISVIVSKKPKAFPYDFFVSTTSNMKGFKLNKASFDKPLIPSNFGLFSPSNLQSNHYQSRKVIDIQREFDEDQELLDLLKGIKVERPNSEEQLFKHHCQVNNTNKSSKFDIIPEEDEDKIKLLNINDDKNQINRRFNSGDQATIKFIPSNNKMQILPCINYNNNNNNSKSCSIRLEKFKKKKVITDNQQSHERHVNNAIHLKESEENNQYHLNNLIQKISDHKSIYTQEYCNMIKTRFANDNNLINTNKNKQTYLNLHAFPQFQELKYNPLKQYKNISLQTKEPLLIYNNLNNITNKSYNTNPLSSADIQFNPQQKPIIFPHRSHIK